MSGFSAHAYIKSKYQARLDVESDWRWALSQLLLNITKLIKTKQCEPSY